MAGFGKVAAGVVVVAALTGGAWYARYGRTREVQGGCGEAFTARICTWATVAGDQVKEVGILVPDGLAERVPASQPMQWPPRASADLPFPEQAQRLTGIQHLTVFWEDHGHPPGPYLVPHFDFHFYYQSPAETAAIDCSDQQKPADVPAGYQLPDVPIPGMGTLVGLCVPGMGMHAAPIAELNSNTPFRGTMIVGYYKGKMIFVEPMLSKELLQAHRDFPLEMPTLAVPAGAAVPTRFRGEYDASAHGYRFVFSGFRKA